MIASQIALTACLGCVPIESTQSFQRSEWSEGAGQLEITASPSLENGGALAFSKPQLSTRPTSPIEWAANDDMTSLRVTAEGVPDPIMFETAEHFTAKMTITAPSSETGLGLDLSLAPRATLEKRGQFSTARAGAEFRVGQGLDDMVDRLDQRGKSVKIDSWYVFAATDGEALCWDLGEKGANFDGVALRDQVTVGDIQAGVAFQKAGGALSFGYVHREYSQEGAKAKEDFAAVSFTLKR